MAQSIHLELPFESDAVELLDVLGRRGITGRLASNGARFEIEVSIEREADWRVREALDALRAWLSEQGLPEVSVLVENGKRERV